MEQVTNHYDVVVIGGGPGGYVAAVRASQLGLKAALIEKEALGGTCLNWGCVPTKALLRHAEVLGLLTKGSAFGFKFENLTVDYAAAHKRSRSIVQRQTRRIALLMKKYGISVFEGSARLMDEHKIRIDNSGETLSGKHIVIATGAKARSLPNIPFDGQKVINYRHALDLKKLPAEALIIGAGPIGMEFATLWSRYGTKVTVVEMLPCVVPTEDTDISIEAEKQYKRQGISIKTSSLVKEASFVEDGLEVVIATGEIHETLKPEVILVAIGFTANIDDLALESAGVATARGHIEVDEFMRTNVPHIYAIGDVNGKMGLAHVASAQGMIAAESIAGKSTSGLVYSNIPRCIFTQPEIASVGLTENQARQQGYDVLSTQCPFVANGKALALDENHGFVKVVADASSKKILGVHMIGPQVTEMVAGPAGLIAMEAGAVAFDKFVHPHPTLSEAVMEAAHALMGHAIHI